jgi:hypothetical protein
MFCKQLTAREVPMAKSGKNESPIVLKLLRQKDKREAANWLTTAPKGVHRNIGEMTHEDSVKYIKDLYQLGAREIVAVNIGINGMYESTDTLVATLPDKPAARKAIWDSEEKRVEEMGYEMEPDVGQQYMFLWFD